LAALTWHALRKNLKSSRRRGIVEKPAKKAAKRFEGQIVRVLNGFKSFSRPQAKARVPKMRKNECWKNFFGLSPHN